MYEASTPSLINSLLVRVGATVNVTGFAKDNWTSYLGANSGGVSGTLNDLERAFFKIKGGSGNTTHDVVDSYLNSKSYTGDYKDKVIQFCQGATTF